MKMTIGEELSAIYTRFEQISDDIDKLNDKVTCLQGGWTNVEIKKASFKPFPKVGETIYRLNSRGEIIEQTWTDSRKQNDARMFMGVYKTREEAQMVRAGIMTFVSEEEFVVDPEPWLKARGTGKSY